MEHIFAIGTMLNVSTGCEPFFMLSYTRKTESLNEKEVSYYQVDLPIVEEYKKVTGNIELPNYFITSQNLNWKNRIRMQAVLQDYCDTAISSTVNLPEDATIKDVKDLYMYAWARGLKGVTIFRNNCKRLGILTTNESKNKEKDSDPIPDSVLPRGFVVKADDTCIGLKRTLTTGCGTLHVTAYFDSITGDLRETYLSKGSKGGCQNFMIGLSRMISLAARGGLSIDAVIDQLNSCGVCPSYAVRTATKKDTSKGACCPTAVGIALKDMHKEVLDRLHNCKPIDTESNPESTVEDTPIDYEICPECHQKGLTHIGGCNECVLCGFSKCN